MDKSSLHFNLEEIEQIIKKYNDITIAEKLYKDINIIKNKLEDDFLYLGVIGVFSSGKSTLINSMIGNSILPTNAIQGTTVATSILKKSDVDDLEVMYLDGKNIKFSTNQSIFDEKYEYNSANDVTVEAKSLWMKFTEFIKILFQIGKREREAQLKKLKRERIKKLYRFIISAENQALDIEYMTLYLNEEKINYNIALVDTPGTESLNDRHDAVTKNAIDNICDALVVVIPSHEPVSESLVKYIQSNIENYTDKCIFVVTKIETLSKQSELPVVVEWIKQSIIAQLKIEDPIVIPLPTLLHLVDVDKTVTTSLFDEMSDEVKKELLSLYEIGLHKLYTVLNEKREIFLKKRVHQIYTRILKELKHELDLLLEEKVKINAELEKQSVVGLQKYRKATLKRIQGFVDDVVSNEIMDQIEISNGISIFTQGLFQTINECKNSYNLIAEIGELDFDEFFKTIQIIASNYEKQRDKDKRKYLEKIKKEFLLKYSCCNLEANISSEKVIMDLQQINNALEEMEESFRQLKQEVDNEIKKEHNGILNKLKNLLDNPSSRHISMVRERMDDLFKKLEERIHDEWNSALISFKSKYKSSLDSAVQKMINNNQNRIDCYISNNTSEIISNMAAKENLLKDIEIINSKNI